jgi:hypothetical protein
VFVARPLQEVAKKKKQWQGGVSPSGTKSVRFNATTLYFVQREVTSLQKTPHRIKAEPFTSVNALTVSDFANVVGLMFIFHYQLQGLSLISCSVPTVTFFL